MTTRIPILAAAALASALALSACGEGSVQQSDEVGSGAGPTGGTGAPSGRTTTEENRPDGDGG